MSTPRPNVRVSVDLNAEGFETLEQIATEMGISKAAAMRRGLALLKFYQEQHERGRKVGAVDKDDDLDTEVVLGAY